MGHRIVISAGDVTAEAELNDTETAQAIFDALPLEALANIWGDEIYFGIPVECDAENQHEVVEFGDLGYWPPGNAFCIFFGPTPSSRGDEIRPASAVNVFGKVMGDVMTFKSVSSGETVTIEPAEV